MSSLESSPPSSTKTTIKLALLGDDARAFAQLKSLLESTREGRRIELTSTSPHASSALRATGVAVPEKEDSAGPVSCDAVLVAGDDAATLEAARNFAAAGKPLLVVPVAGQTTAFAYELTLLQTDNATLFLPLFAWRTHPQIQSLRTLIQSRTLGQVQHLEIERRVVPTPLGGRLPVREISNDFLEDVDLLRLLLGEIASVTATRVGNATEGVWSQSVTLSSRTGVPATWSVTTDAEKNSWRLAITATGGRVVLESAGDSPSLSCKATGLPQQIPTLTPAAGAGGVWGLAFLGLLNSDTRSGAAIQKTTIADWVDFTRAFEVLEGIDRSLRRRRTIDLEFEVPSERSQFKTHMTATGCSLLILTLIAVVAFLLGAQLLGISPSSESSKSAKGQSKQNLTDVDEVKEQGPTLKTVIAVIVIFLPLGIFLALQIFYFIARPRPGPVATAAADRKADRSETS